MVWKVVVGVGNNTKGLWRRVQKLSNPRTNLPYSLSKNLSRSNAKGRLLNSFVRNIIRLCVLRPNRPTHQIYCQSADFDVTRFEWRVGNWEETLGHDREKHSCMMRRWDKLFLSVLPVCQSDRKTLIGMRRKAYTSRSRAQRTHTRLLLDPYGN